MCALEIGVTKVRTQPLPLLLSLSLGPWTGIWATLWDLKRRRKGLSEETKTGATYQVQGTLQTSSRSPGREGWLSYFSDEVTQAQGSKATCPRPTENGRAGARTMPA